MLAPRGCAKSPTASEKAPVCFVNLLRCCGPPRAGDLVLRADVERTGERNASTRIHLGVKL